MMIKENNETKVVVIGGGTGLSTMLRGLKQYTSHITAIVTVGDDGGGSGGSSYISGHLGSVAIKSSSDTSPRLDENGIACINGTNDNICSLHYSGFYFYDTDHHQFFFGGKNFLRSVRNFIDKNPKEVNEMASY